MRQYIPVKHDMVCPDEPPETAVLPGGVRVTRETLSLIAFVETADLCEVIDERLRQLGLLPATQHAPSPQEPA